MNGYLPQLAAEKLGFANKGNGFMCHLRGNTVGFQDFTDNRPVTLARAPEKADVAIDSADQRDVVRRSKNAHGNIKSISRLNRHYLVAMSERNGMQPS